jgi:hypothetical protein
VTILVPALAVTFAAFCVWLGVRVFNRRERWAKWTAVSVAVLTAYPLSVGPTVWLLCRGYLSADVAIIYLQPVRWLQPSLAYDVLVGYASYWQ